jgi:hypothetical protein
MKVGAPGAFGAQLQALREGAGFTHEELATIAVGGHGARSAQACAGRVRRSAHVSRSKWRGRGSKLLEPIGYVPPAEFEAAYDQQTEAVAVT